jgi:hypothetical protein
MSKQIIIKGFITSISQFDINDIFVTTLGVHSHLAFNKRHSHHITRSYMIVTKFLMTLTLAIQVRRMNCIILSPNER